MANEKGRGRPLYRDTKTGQIVYQNDPAPGFQKGLTMHDVVRAFTETRKLPEKDYNPLHVAQTALENVAPSTWNAAKGFVNLGYGLVTDPWGIPGAMYEQGKHIVQHPIQSFAEDPVGTWMAVEGAANLAKAGLRRAKGAPTPAPGAVVQPAPKPGLVRRIASIPTAVTEKVVTGPAARVAEGAVRVAKQVRKTGRETTGKQVAKAWAKPKPPSTAPVVANRRGNLTPVARQAIADTGLSPEAQAALHADTTFHSTWQTIANELGITPQSARQAVLQHSGIPEANITRSMTHREQPVPGRESYSAANLEAARETAGLNEPPAAPTGPTPQSIGGYTFENGAWRDPNGGTVNPTVARSLSQNHQNLFGFDPAAMPSAPPPPAGPSPDTAQFAAHEILNENPATYGQYTGPKVEGKLSTAGRLAREGLASAAAWVASGHPAAIEAGRRLIREPSHSPSAISALEEQGAQPLIHQQTAPARPGAGALLMAASASEDRKPEEDPNAIQFNDRTIPTGQGIPIDELLGESPEPQGQWRGGRTAYKKGGKVEASIEPLVQALMNKAKKAKKVSNKATEPLLNAHDDAIATALAAAQKAI